MSTPMAEIIVNNAKVEIDDVRLDDALDVNPAQYFRRMWFYLFNGIPLFNRPPEIRQYLSVGMVTPKFDDYAWISTEESLSQPTTVRTELKNFELFSCSLVETDGAGNVVHTPYTAATYDSTSGNVVFPKQSSVGLEYTIDFYTDGSFAPDLTITQRRILGLCVAVVWYERFAGNWLNMQPKVKDRNNETGSEGSHMNASTNRLKEVRGNLNSELRKFEQDCEYARIVSPSSGIKNFV